MLCVIKDFRIPSIWHVIKFFTTAVMRDIDSAAHPHGEVDIFCLEKLNDLFRTGGATVKHQHRTLYVFQHHL